MDEHHQQLVQYIQTQLQNGAPLDAIRSALIQAGWQTEMVDHAVQAVSTPVHAHEAPAAPFSAHQPSQPAYAEAAQPAQESQQFASQFQPQAEQVAQINQANASSQPSTESVDANVPKKYKVFRSIADGLIATKNNFPAYISATISSLLIGTFALGLLGTLMTPVAKKISSFTLGSNPMTGFVVTIGIFMIVFAAFYAVLYAFITASMSFPLMSGAEHKQDNVLKVLVHAMKRVPKIIAANLAVMAIVLAPYIVLLILILGSFVLNRASGVAVGMILLSVVIYVLSLAWVIIALLRYALIPYVVMFEDNLSIRQALKRSRYLLTGGGQRFLFKGALLEILVVVVIAAISHQNLHQLQSSNQLSTGIPLLIMAVLINNSMVMLYRNRKLVRGSQQ